MLNTALGTHCILELYDCPFDALNNEQLVSTAIVDAASTAMSTLLNISSHAFDPQGVTALALLAESHISVHTWPELGYAAVDIFTCGQTARPRQACELIAERLQAGNKALRVVPRGGDFTMTASPKTLPEAEACLATK